ncbi:hypothetical protein K469DRAFT_673478 [Zopfia rhizophila CBS 207.26]|uniref:YCII-related domain-containing protein n=1 Tax=Zopfia rhizophila CBS 207.26 TaxID=1314779 RepID=A0A6A6DP29_9PEZI|nr:hypothetical protein K469DRAFT_673478 [Zopfia rhizophila CBS 207.26]
MPVFLVNGTGVVAQAEIEKFMPGHIAFLEENFHKGHFLMLAKKVPWKGGVFLATTPSREALQEIIDTDPFVIHKIAHFDIQEIAPTHINPELPTFAKR